MQATELVVRLGSGGVTIMATLVCVNCRTENAEDARFCKKCGQRVGDDYIDPDLEQRLYERIETRLTNKWISKSLSGDFRPDCRVF